MKFLKCAIRILLWNTNIVIYIVILSALSWTNACNVLKILPLNQIFQCGDTLILAKSLDPKPENFVRLDLKPIWMQNCAFISALSLMLLTTVFTSDIRQSCTRDFMLNIDYVTVHNGGGTEKVDAKTKIIAQNT